MSAWMVESFNAGNHDGLQNPDLDQSARAKQSKGYAPQVIA